jgi:hypothetical protein
MKVDTNSEDRIPAPLFQASTSNRPNVFIFLLLLSERRSGEPWEPPNRMMLFLSQQ